MLLHDAVRPLVTAADHRRVLRGARGRTRRSTWPSRRPTRSSRSPPDDIIRDIPPRATLRRGQTPQAFRASVIKEAYAQRDARPRLPATDDCTVVLRYLPDVPIWVVQGDERNMKVTEPDRRLPRRQAVPAHQPATCRQPGDRRGLPRRPAGQDDGRLRRQLRHRRRHRRAGTRATAPTCSRLQPVQHQHPRGAARRHRRGGRRGARRRPAASTTWSTPRASSPAARCWRPRRRRSTPPPRSTTWRRSSSPRSSTRTSRQTQGSLLLFTVELLHPRPRRLQPLLLGQGRRRQPHPGAGRRVGGRPACGSTASTPSAPRPRCAPRRSARSPRTRCSTPMSVARSSLDVLHLGPDRAHHRRPQGRPVRRRARGDRARLTGSGLSGGAADP